MKKMRLLHRGLKLLTLVFFLTFGLLMFLSPNELYAETSDKVKTGTTEQTDGTTGASQTEGTAGASQQKFEHYVPLPIKPVHREANNVLLGSGLVVAALITCGACVLDKRKGN